MKIKRRDVKSKGGHCPYLTECGHRVPKNYFRQICNTEAYRNCRHYAGKAGELNKPMDWLQKLAIEHAKKKSGRSNRKRG